LYLVESKVDSVGDATPIQQRELVDEVLALLNGRELTVDDLRLGVNLARGVEGSKNYALAAEVYTQFGALFAGHSEERLANYAQKLTGSARRMGLAGGDAIEIKGKLIDGSEFDWSPYKGKVVLVDYWATWCGPCIAELPNVLEQYELYHDKGFEVVGISLDSDREKLTKFVEERAIPWVQLFEDGAGWEHSMANYYGVMSIPTVILVDQKGTVVSMSARGKELGKQLEKLLGPVEKDAETEEGDAAEAPEKKQ
jgi:thiol-disulfide isomerase/thioredoxin